MNFGIYLIGYLLVIVGACYGLHLAHVPQQWIVVTAVVLLGAGILTGVQNTRTKDKSE